MTFNQMLWAGPDILGWYFWIPLVPCGVFGLWWVYQTASAESPLGRKLRVVLVMGFFCLVFLPVFNGLGPYALHLLAIGGTLYMKRRLDLDRESGRITKPTGATLMERVAEHLQEDKRTKA